MQLRSKKLVQEASVLLSNLGLKIPLSKIHVCNILFTIYKINETVNESLLGGDNSCLKRINNSLDMPIMLVD